MFHQGVHHIYYHFFKDLVRYPHVREGVSAPGGWVWLAHAMVRLNNIVGLWPYGQHGEHCLEILCKYIMSVMSKRNNQRVGRIPNSDLSTSFCFYYNLFFNKLKWMKLLLLFQSWPSALIYAKQITQINSFVNMF